MSDVTLNVNMTLLILEGRLLIKTSQIEKVWIVEKNDCCYWLSSQRHSGNGIYELLGLLALPKGSVVAIDVVRSELIQISSQLIT